MHEPATGETINLHEHWSIWSELIALIRARPIEVLGGTIAAIFIVGAALQQFIIEPLATARLSRPMASVSATATLPTLDARYPSAFTRAVSVYNEPDLTTYRGPVETGRRYTVVARSGPDWYLLDIQDSGAGWVPGEFLEQAGLAVVEDLATPVVQVEVQVVEVVVTATPVPPPPPAALPPAALPAPAPVMPVVIVAPTVPPAPPVVIVAPTAPPAPPVPTGTVLAPAPPVSATEVPWARTATSEFPVLVRGEPRYRREATPTTNSE